MRGEGFVRNKCNVVGRCDERGNKGCQLNKRRVLFHLTACLYILLFEG